MNLIAKLRGALRSATMWVNGLFLAAYPFADQIVQGVQENLPGLAQYLPANVFKTVGLAVILFNIYQRTRTSKSLAEKGAK
jgi:hypothetical protein